MSHEHPGEAVLVPLLLEVGFFGWLALSIAGSFTGHTAALASVDPALRVLVALLAASFALAPLWIYYDVRRADDSLAWVHVAVLPLVNLVGLAAYLHHRRQRSGAPSGAEAPSDE